MFDTFVEVLKDHVTMKVPRELPFYSRYRFS